jgi:hypothetical protein
MENYIQIINDYEELYSEMGENLCAGGHPKQPPAQKASVLAVSISARQQKLICSSGREPASTKGHFYCLKVAGGCCARQQRPVLATRTNHFWRSVLICTLF